MCHDTELNLKQVAQRLDVHYMTVYRYVRSGRLPARREGNVWIVDGADLAAFCGTADHDHVAPEGRSVDWVARLTDRLVEGDEAGAWATAEAALVAGHDADSLLGLVADAVRESGAHPDRPSAPYLSVVTAERTIAVLASRFRRSGRRRGAVVLGAPGDEGHGFALCTLAAALRLRNLQVLELGTSVPPAAFIDAARRADRLLAIGLGVTTVERLDDAATAITEIRAVLPDVWIVLGGQAVRNIEVAALTGADAWAQDRAGVVEILEKYANERRWAQTVHA